MFSEIVPSLRRRLPALALATLAAALVVLPAVAGSETSPTIEAEDKPGGIYSEEHHAWVPPSVAVGEGGVVTLKNPSSTVPHGVEWVGGPAKPSCAGIPVGKGMSGTSWGGTCTFAQAGTYTFYCTVHGSEMTGTITVNANGTVAPGPGSPAGPSSPTGPGGSPGGSGSGGSVGASGSPFAGGAKALKLAASQHGRSVHGSIAVSSAGASGELEVSLLATSASLAKAHHPKRVRVGHFVRSSVKAGVVSFAVPLTTRGKSALRRHRRLALTVRIVLTPFYGTPASMTKSVVLHA